jgi:hypothetical protein
MSQMSLMDLSLSVTSVQSVDSFLKILSTNRLNPIPTNAHKWLHKYTQKELSTDVSDYTDGSELICDICAICGQFF